MTKHDLGLPSGIQDSTYQQNREERMKLELLLLKDFIKIIRSEIKAIEKEN
jgi:hypothetical protein